MNKVESTETENFKINVISLTNEKTEDQIRETVLMNILNMLECRGWLDMTYWTKGAKANYIKKRSDTDVYVIESLIIPLNDYVQKKNNLRGNKLTEKDLILKKNAIYIKLINQKILNAYNASIVIDFLTQHNDLYKFIVVDSISDKQAKAYIDYGKLEIFEEKFLMVDLSKVPGCPKYEILSENNQVFNDYMVTKNQLLKMLKSDPYSKYFNLDSNEIVKVTRSSSISGAAVAYRIVV